VVGYPEYEELMALLGAPQPSPHPVKRVASAVVDSTKLVAPIVGKTITKSILTASVVTGLGILHVVCSGINAATDKKKGGN
jgi:hypothetical protein